MLISLFSGMVRRLARSVAGDRVLHNIGWLGLSDGIGRISRIATTVIVARMLTAADLGIAAIAITVFEIVRAFASSGIGQMVVRSSPERLAATAAAANRANWLLCGLLAVAQILVGAVLAARLQRPDLLLLVGCLGGVFLLMPLGLMQCYAIMREERLHVIARISAVQLVTDNVLTAGLALAGFGAWAVVLPKLLTAPIWMIGMRRAAEWKRDPAVQPIPAIEVWTFAAPVLASEVLAAARQNLDKVIVGSALGVEMLGIYYFAYNAGLGLSQSLTNALSTSVYPALAALAQQPAELVRRFDRILVRNALPLSLLIGVQALAALVLVPIVFGERWAPVAPMVAVLCCSALTKPASDAAAQLLRAAGYAGHELVTAIVLSVVYLGSFQVLVPHGLGATVFGVAAICVFVQAGITLWARWFVRQRAGTGGGRSIADRVAPATP